MQRKGIPSGPGALRGEEEKIASLISVGVKGTHARAGGGSFVVVWREAGGGGNMVVLNKAVFSSKVVDVVSLKINGGDLSYFRGFVNRRAVKMSVPLALARTSFHTACFAVRMARKYWFRKAL
jgi:hypothetical protein